MIAVATEKLVGCLTSHIHNQVIIGLSLRTICNLSSSRNSLVIRGMIEAGILDAFYALLINGQPNTHREVFWGLSNLAADCKQVTKQIIQHEILEKVGDMTISFDLSLKKEAFFCCCNIITCGSPDDILMMLKIHAYFLGNIFSCAASQSNQWKVQMEALSVIQRLCEMDDELGLNGEESFKYMLETSKGLDLL